MAYKLSTLPQAAMRSDRMSCYEQWPLAVRDALLNEFQHGMATIKIPRDGRRVATLRLGRLAPEPAYLTRFAPGRRTARSLQHHLAAADRSQQRRRRGSHFVRDHAAVPVVPVKWPRSVNVGIGGCASRI